MNAREGLFAIRLVEAAAAEIVQGSFKEDFFDRVLDVLPKLAKAAIFSLGALGAEALARVSTAGLREGAIHDAKHFADGNFVRIARQSVTAMDAAAAFENSAALELEKNLLEIFQGNVMASGDLLDGDHGRILAGQMQGGLRGVFAFGGDSHGRDKRSTRRGKCQSSENLRPGKSEVARHVGCQSRNVVDSSAPYE